MNACTIVARNYLAHARVLATSYARHHPGRRLSVLVIDGSVTGFDGRGEPFETVLPEQLPIASDEFSRMAGIYDVMELATALKPFFLRFLLDRDQEPTIYLDPDIQVFASLDELGDLAEERGIVLTPHTLAPVPVDGLRPTFAELAQAGVYNLGFVGVAPSAHPFLDWWSERLRRDCISAPDEGLFVDQRVMDFAPALSPTYIERRPPFNVAYWNLHERSLAWVNGRYEANGEALRFFHFSGFDPDSPRVLSKHQGSSPRTFPTNEPVLTRLRRQYARALLKAGYRHVASLSYGFSTMYNGVPLDRRMRRLYRQALIAAEQNGTPLPLNPLDPEQADAFVTWLLMPSMEAPQLSQYLYSLYRERADLQVAFADVNGPDFGRYIDWIAEGGLASPPVPDVVRQAAVQIRAALTTRSLAWHDGVNILGYVKAELGVGEGARLTVAAAKAGDIPYAVVPYAGTLSRQKHPFADYGTGSPTFPVNIIHINADMLPDAAAQHRWLLEQRYNIGVWAWELDEFPPEMASSADHLDEIWAISAFTARAIASVVSKPVYAYPFPVVRPAPPTLARSQLGLPNSFVFLFCFDFFSVLERKNPLGLIEAFKRAFAPGEGPVLVIKSINGSSATDAYERLLARVGDRPDILILDGYLAHDHVHALMEAADCYVSLHRSEGFGLTMAESMALGKPVIATGYSGNLDFMDPRNSFLVPFELVPIPAGCGPYREGALWADPDIDAAASLLREVYDNPRLAAAVGQRAQADMERSHSPKARATFIQERIEAARDSTLRRGHSGIGEPRREAASGAIDLSVAARLATAGPTLGSRHRLVRVLQRPLIRILRPLILHERAMAEQLVDAITELDRRWLEIAHSVAEAEGDVVRMRHEVRALEQELAASRTNRVEGPEWPEQAAVTRIERAFQEARSRKASGSHMQSSSARSRNGAGRH